MDDQENESQEHPTEPLHIQSSAERRDRDILRTERSQLAKLAQVIRLADFMAILMVLATFFSAYATWRTAMLTSTIFAVSDRPFLVVPHAQTELLIVISDFNLDLPGLGVAEGVAERLSGNPVDFVAQNGMQIPR